jgi:hypothetical protein
MWLPFAVSQDLREPTPRLDGPGDLQHVGDAILSAKRYRNARLPVVATPWTLIDDARKRLP